LYSTCQILNCFPHKIDVTQRGWRFVITSVRRGFLFLRFLMIVRLPLFILEMDLLLLRLPVVWRGRWERRHGSTLSLKITLLFRLLQRNWRIILINVLMVDRIGLVFVLE
jgi:hypothetical protein